MRALATVIAAAVLPGLAWAGECSVTVTVRPEITIAGPQRSGVPPDDAPSGLHVLGRVMTEDRMETVLSFDREPAGAGHCPRNVVLAVVAGAPPGLWLSDGLEPGSCRYRSTLAHELRHVRHYHGHLERFGAAVRAMFPGPVRLRMEPAGSVEATADRLGAMLDERVIRAIRDGYARSRDRALAQDRMIDAPDRLALLDRLCR